MLISAVKQRSINTQHHIIHNRGHVYISCKTKTNIILKLQPDIFPLSQHIICFHNLPADTTQCFYNRAICIMHRYCIMLHRLYASSTIYCRGKKITCPGARDKLNFRQDKHIFSPNVRRTSKKFSASLLTIYFEQVN